MSRSRSKLFDADTNPVELRITLNVGGQRHETYVSTLASVPDTRLTWIAERSLKESRPLGQRKEYFFDRNPSVFTHILNYYRTGKLHCPREVCGPLFEEELVFWGIDEKQIETCCWAKYDEHRDAEEKLRGFTKIKIDEEESADDDEEEAGEHEIASSGEFCSNSRTISIKSKTKLRVLKKRIWRTLDDPYSSKLARIIGFVSLLFSVAVVAKFCLLTMEYFSNEFSPQYMALFIIEAVAVTWFTVDLVLRLICCPSKIDFVKDLHNWVDLLAIVPFYLTVILPHNRTIRNFSVFYVLRLTRTFRPLKFSYVMQVFTQTLKASSRELYFLMFILGILVITYGSVAYFAERDQEDTLFTSIPASFWWAVVTMTTVGYGDMHPKTLAGKLIGSVCAISGVLMIALPVSVVASNFSLYNSYAKVKLKLPARQKRNVVDTALKALQLSTPHQSICADNAEHEGKPRRSRYGTSLPGLTEMTILNSKTKCAIGDDSNNFNHVNDKADPRSRYARRSAHVSLQLGSIAATPELPETESETEENDRLINSDTNSLNGNEITETYT